MSIIKDAFKIFLKNKQNNKKLLLPHKASRHTWYTTRSLRRLRRKEPLRKWRRIPSQPLSRFCVTFFWKKLINYWNDLNAFSATLFRGLWLKIVAEMASPVCTTLLSSRVWLKACVSICVWVGGWKSERERIRGNVVCACVREKKVCCVRVWDNQRKRGCVCVCVRACECLCVCFCLRVNLLGSLACVC
jgi:hypothetical protein